MTTCSKCLLIASLPNSNFNAKGECSWCQTDFPNYKPKGEQQLVDILNKNRSKTSAADCLVGISGGKDSTYALMKMKNTYGMNVEAFTYVHEGTAPVSVENAKKVCMKLEVTHHIVSLPEQTHLRTFNTFFKAWIEHPSTVSAGMVCVACKHLHRLGYELASKRNIPMIVWASSPLECPPFLALGLKGGNGEEYERSSVFSSVSSLVKEMIQSPKFAIGVAENLSTCFQGCLAVSPTSKHLQSKYPTVTPIMLFQYLEWNPRIIVEEIIRDVGWEKPCKDGDDWHSDCLFHHFKEYMFRKMLGVSYLEGYLSNQVRYGIMSREEAIESLEQSKQTFVKEFPQVIRELGMDDLANKIDYSVGTNRFEG